MMHPAYVDISVDKALVAVAIEKTLLDIKLSLYDEVISSLYKKYHCHIPDCYEHPDYLKSVLKYTCEESYNKVVNQIEKKLRDETYNSRIETFLEILLR